jgi:hypothetical protein
VIARVVTKREEARPALTASLLSALGLAWVAVNDLGGGDLFRPPSDAVFLLVAALIGLAAVGPWAAWKRKGRTTTVTCEPGVVRAGHLIIHAGEVTALRMASGARGRNVVFLEVERADEAARIAEALDVPLVPFGELGVPPVRTSLAIVQALVGVVALVCIPLYLAGAMLDFELAGMSTKPLFGITGLATSWVALALLVARRLLPGQAIAIGRGTWDAHAELHRGYGADAELDDEAARAEPIRVANLGRGDEGVGAWLARLDAIPTVEHAYRGDAMKKDVLWDTLGDASAPVDARMAAARVLRRRYGEEESALVRVVDDREVRVRVEAALEEHDEAEQHIERLGPLFRAR